MKGGVRVRLDLDAIDYDEGWCASETWSWCNWLWWRVVCEWDLILMQLTMMKGGVRVRLDLDAIDYDEGWCASETWSWCNWLWWRVVCEWDLILMQLTMMKGGARVRLDLDGIDYDEGWYLVRKGGSRSTKPYVFPCKVAAAGDESYLVCATVAAAVGLSFFSCRTVTVPWSCFGCVSVCVVLCVSWSCGCRSHWNGCMNVAWAMLRRGSQSTKPCVFPCKVAAGGDESYLVCATVAAAVGLSFFSCRTVTVPWSCFGCVSVCVVLCVSWSCGCRSHWNGCMNVAWAMLRRGSQSTKPCVFPCKVAAGGDESYLVCATVAAAVGLSFFSCRTVTVPWSCFGCVSVCVVLCVSWSCGCRSHWNGCMNVAWAMLWRGSQSTKPCVFPCKVAAGDDESYLVCATVAAAVGLSFFFLPQCNCALKLLWVCFCLRSSMRFLKLWLQIALEWLHECCMGNVVERKPEHETLRFSV